ncbi:MAG TPA: HNH endonuclease signature motif containing protein, partial [Anaeromyxobacteraceae bacterium]|nr:HNH endonuclease signature motif containing protein [Anaeromyxobacteraceae bacterium]
VRLRDGDRCQFPLDAGGVCGSTWMVELDHVVPVALGGEPSAANLRCLCRKHNQAAALEALGPAAGGRRSGLARRGAWTEAAPGARQVTRPS